MYTNFIGRVSISSFKFIDHYFEQSKRLDWFRFRPKKNCLAVATKAVHWPSSVVLGRGWYYDTLPLHTHKSLPQCPLLHSSWYSPWWPCWRHSQCFSGVIPDIFLVVFSDGFKCYVPEIWYQHISLLMASSHTATSRKQRLFRRPLSVLHSNLPGGARMIILVVDEAARKHSTKQNCIVHLCIAWDSK